MLIIAGVLFFLFFLVCMFLPRARKYLLHIVKMTSREIKGICLDYLPRAKHSSWWKYIATILLLIPTCILLIVFTLLVGPFTSLYLAIFNPKSIDKELEFEAMEREWNWKEKVPKKTPEEIAEANRIWYEKMMAVRFTVDRNDIPYDPDEHEVFFYTPEHACDIEKTISSQYYEIKSAFEQRHLSFVFLPYFNKELNVMLNADKVSYYNPKAANLLRIPIEALSYQDIKEALKIPEKVDGPCFIRYKQKDDNPLIFSFFKIELPENGDIMPVVQDYLNNVGDGRMYHLPSDEEIRRYAEGKSADERFGDDMFLIGKEIRERIDKLRTMGLTSLAIRKLIGEDADKPGRLIISKQKHLLLPDYGNREIKLEPLQKAVYFLFLRHPEGIFFKDLESYKDELTSIYKEITGRQDMTAVESSITRLVDPFDNSINEKCARIKNAFVSEFREELAQWYFIDGSKGERKSISLPRDLVIWEDRN